MQNLIKLLVLFGACCIEAQFSYEKYSHIWDKEVHVNYTCVIEHTDMKGIEADFSDEQNADKVQAFYIHHTTSTTIPQDYVKIFTKLINLRVEHTDLKLVTAKVLLNLSQLKNLYLGKNQIDEIGHDAFDSFHNLETLYLNGNKISQLDDLIFASLHKLKMIMLDDNHLKRLSAKLFSRNLKLKNVYVANNKIKYIAPSFFDHLSIKNCDLTNNKCINLKTGWNNIQDLKLQVENCCQVHNYRECMSASNGDNSISSDFV